MFSFILTLERHHSETSRLIPISNYPTHEVWPLCWQFGLRNWFRHQFLISSSDKATTFFRWLPWPPWPSSRYLTFYCVSTSYRLLASLIIVVFYCKPICNEIPRYSANSPELEMMLNSIKSIGTRKQNFAKLLVSDSTKIKFVIRMIPIRKVVGQHQNAIWFITQVNSLWWACLCTVLH